MTAGCAPVFDLKYIVVPDNVTLILALLLTQSDELVRFTPVASNHCPDVVSVSAIDARTVDPSESRMSQNAVFTPAASPTARFTVHTPGAGRSILKLEFDVG